MRRVLEEEEEPRYFYSRDEWVSMEEVPAITAVDRLCPG